MIKNKSLIVPEETPTESSSNTYKNTKLVKKLTRKEAIKLQRQEEENIAHDIFQLFIDNKDEMELLARQIEEYNAEQEYGFYDNSNHKRKMQKLRR